jgi:peptidyl-prolyl cis-trans isomerase B (cyclophilin B)
MLFPAIGEVLIHTDGMPSGRASKRARQKQRRAARVESWTQAYRRRRRQRLFLFIGSLVVIAIGVGIVLLANPFGENTKKLDQAKPRASVPPAPTPVACGKKQVPITAALPHKKYSKAGDANLDPNKKYVWKLDTSCGEIDIALDTEHNPKTTNSIAFLAKNKFFDGLFFHRVSAQVSVIQGGDPTGQGIGGAGYSVIEPPPEGTRYTRGIVAMAKSGQEATGTSGSQFFIVYGDAAANLPTDYAVVGEVVKGMSVVDKIAKTRNPTSPEEKPKAYTYIERSTVVAE